MKERILLIGGAGFVGKNLISELKKYYELTCLVRKSTDESNIDFLKSNKIKLIFCDDINKEILYNALNNIDIVIYLIGIIKETKEQKFRILHYENVKNLIEICKKKSIEKIVYFSALGADTTITEYFYTKFKAEEELKKSGLNYIIFRPSIMFGKEDKSINNFIDTIKKHRFVFYFSTKKMQPAYVKDVVKCVRLSLKNKWNKIYEIGGLDKLNLEEIFDFVIENLNLKRKKIRIPLFFIKIISLFPNPFLTYDQLKMLQIDNVTNFNAQKEFSFKFLSFEDYLRKLK